MSHLRAGRLRRLLCDGDALQCAVVPLGALSIFGRSSLLFDAATVSAWLWQGLIVLELGGDVHVVAICEFLEHVFHGELARVGAIGLVNVVGESDWSDGIREIILFLKRRNRHLHGPTPIIYQTLGSALSPHQQLSVLPSA